MFTWFLRSTGILSAVFFRGHPSTVSCAVPSCEIACFRWIPTWEPNSQAIRLKALLSGISLSEYGSEGFRVRLRRLSEYGSVAYLVERPTRETQAEQYSDTALILKSGCFKSVISCGFCGSRGLQCFCKLLPPFHLPVLR